MATSQTEKTCGCQTAGLAILPVRYTVVPTYLERAKPNWVNLPSVTNVPLAEGYQYHVRSLRKGYLYIYLPAEMEDDKWQIYTIDNEGHLFKQSSNTEIKSVSEIKETGEHHCPNLEENCTHNNFVTIANPQYQQKIYIAYSEFIWSDELLKKYEQSPEQRMQLVDPAQWKGGNSHYQSATAATQKNIEQILDYDPNFDQNHLPYDNNHKVKASLVLDKKAKKTEKAEKVNYTDTLSYDKTGLNGDKSKAYGFDDKVLNKNTTCYQWTKQQGQAQLLTYTMKKYSDGYTPILLALDDPLGIGQELNGYYNEIFGKNEQYRQEREFEFNVKESYEYVIQILTQKDLVEDFKYSYKEHPYLKRVIKAKKIERSAELPIFSTYNQLSVILHQQLYGRAGSGDLVGQMRISDDFATNIPIGEPFHKDYNFERAQFLSGNNVEKDHKVEELAVLMGANYKKKNRKLRAQEQIHLISFIEYKFKVLNDRFRFGEKSIEASRKEKIKDIEKKYAKHINTKSFDDKYNLLITRISQIAEIRATQLINWIKQSNFYSHLKDLNGDEWIDINVQDEQINAELDNQFEIDRALSDNEITQEEVKEFKKVNPYGVLYSDIVEKTTAGLELTKVGNEQVGQWFMLSNIDQNNSDSLMWRGVANNSDKILMEIRQLIENAQTIKSDVNIDEVFTTTKVGKLAAYYKKTQSFINAVNNYNDKLETEFTKSGVMPKHGRLLKLVLSKPSLTVNNLILRLSNIIFSPVNVVTLIPNIALSYLFNLSLCGIPKAVSLTFARSQNAINQHILTSPLQTKFYLTSGVVGEFTGTVRKKILERNAKFLRIQNIHYKNIKNMLSGQYRVELAEVNDMVKGEVKEIIKSVKSKPQASRAIKDARLSLIIGLFEAYNWWQLKQKQQDLGLDEFWTNEMTKSTLALSAITTEIIAQYTKVAKGSASIAAGRTKILSGMFGFVLSYYQYQEKLNSYEKENAEGNENLARLYLFQARLYWASGATSLVASITYHIPWSESIIGYLAKKTFTNAFMNTAVSAIVRIMASRAILLALSFWIGVIILLIDGLIWWLSNDELEDWLEYSALGTKNNDPKAYKNLEEQKQQFKKVLESMFGINEDAVKINNNQIELKSISNDKVLDNEDDKEDEFNEYDALLLIGEDLEQQKRIRENILAEEFANEEALKRAIEEAKSYKLNGFHISDIFR